MCISNNHVNQDKVDQGWVDRHNRIHNIERFDRRSTGCRGGDFKRCVQAISMSKNELLQCAIAARNQYYLKHCKDRVVKQRCAPEGVEKVAENTPQENIIRNSCFHLALTER
jgi:hypothetical protein